MSASAAFNLPRLSFIAMLFALCCASCSDQSLYEFGRQVGAAKAECDALTSNDERRQCEAQFERDHRTYEQQRNSL